MGLDAVVSLASLFGPKVIDLIKGIFHRKDSPEQVMSALASTDPKGLADYVNAQAALITAQNASINSDVTGTIPMWVSAVRAMIRPTITIIGAFHIVVAHFKGLIVPQEAMYIYEGAIGSWFGSRLVK